jgi:TonB family protein
VDTVAPKPDLPQIAQLAPQIEPVERPKITLENPSVPPPPVAPGQSKVAIPNASVDQAIREAVKSTAAGGQVVGDLDLGGPGGVGPGINLPPAPGATASNLELLSNPQGVDFRPYLMQILASVRRNWMAVYPESARLGRRGRVSIQFSISRSGSVPKLVITSTSGTDSLDRAAVAGISASNPFPPLPSEYRADRIVLQFNFAYNMPRR